MAALASNVFALAACGDDGSNGGLNGLSVGDVDLSTPEDTAISVALPVHAGTTSNLTITIATQPQHGTVTSTEGDNTTYSYTPAPNYDGPDSFTATVTDGTNTATGTVNITVTPVDDAPVVGAAMFTTGIDTPLTIQVSDLLANATDVEMDTLSVVSVQDTINGNATLDSGAVTFTPASHFFGIATFTYTVSDGHQTTNGTVAVNVGGDNHAPIAVADSATTPENTPLVLPASALLGNDSDADGNTLTITQATNAQHGSVAFDSAANTVTFTPDTNFHGTAQFDYSISDGNGGNANATVTVAVTHVNQNPVANPDSLTVAQGTTGSVNVLGNDTDADNDALTISSVTQGTNGSVTFTGGVASYTPAAGFTGTDSFTYTVSDGNGGTATATVSVTVTGVNHAPIANNDAVTVNQSSAASVDVLGNDSDPDGDTVVISAITNGAHGVTSFSGGTVTYTANTGFTGTDTFTYTITDNRGGIATATVAVNVVPVNTAPVAVNDLFSVPENSFGSTNVLANDRDPDGNPLSVSNFTQPAHGAVAFSGGVATYTPTHDFFGNDSFTYTLSDGNGGVATGVVSVQVTHVNQQPVAQDDTLATTENNTGAVDVAGNDTDADGDVLVVSGFTQPAHGTVAFSNTVAQYTPVANFFGADSFQYTISDGHGATATATVHVTVTQGIDASSEPVANNDSFSGNEDTQITGNVLTNDTGSGLTAVLVSGPGNGELGFNSDGSFSYVPNSNFNGTDTFTYAATDGHVSTNPATVTLTVLPVNDAPFADDFTVSGIAGSHASIAIELGQHAFDIDGDPLSFQIVTQPENGTATVSGSEITYQPTNEGGYIGDTIVYTATDDHNAVSNQATITLALPSCGDGIVNNSVPDGNGGFAFEQCDNGPANGNGVSGCELDCTFTCGQFFDPQNEGQLAVPTQVTANPTTGACFATYDASGISAADAATACIARGGRLATAPSFDDDFAIGNIANGSPWIGANNVQQSGEHWDTGEGLALSFIGGNVNGEGGCTQYVNAFDWNAESCFNGTDQLLCEFDLFSTQDTFATPATPSNLVTGDFNGDGNTDVAFLNAATKTVGVMLGDGFGGFKTSTVAVLPGTPNGLAAGDLDNDGFTDLAVSLGTSGEVAILHNSVQDGRTFDPPVLLDASLGVNGEPQQIAIGDVDVDGFQDVVITLLANNPNGEGGPNGSFHVGAAVVYYNLTNSPGSFETGRGYTLDGSEGNPDSGFPTALAVAQIDQFGDTGIVVTAAANIPDVPSLYVLSRDSSSTDVRDLHSFAEQLDGTPDAVTIGDFNFDDNPDIAVGYADLPQLDVFEGTPALASDGEDGFIEVPGWAFNFDATPNIVVPATSLATMNGGTIVYGTAAANSVTVLDDVDGGEGLRVGVSSHASSFALADFDEDGRTDVVVAGDDSPAVTELPGNANGNFGAPLTTQVTFFPQGAQNPTGLVAADLHDVNGLGANGLPGQSDLVSVNSSANTVSVLSAQNGFFGFDPIDVGQAPAGVAAGDLNGDGFADLVVTNSADGTISVLLNNRFGGFSRENTVFVGNDPEGVVIGDVNDDGFNDVVVALRGDNVVVALTGDGAEGAPLGQPVPIGFASHPSQLAIGALQNQGTDGLDIVVTAEDGPQVLFNERDGDLDFGPGGLLGADLPLAVALGDIDQNGAQDVIILDGATSSVLVYFQDSPGALEASPFQQVAVGNGPTSLVVTDFTGDRFPDIAVANHVGSTVSVVLNSFGSLQNARTLRLGAGAFSVVSGDFDGNGHPDLAVTDQRTDTVEILPAHRGTFTPISPD